MSKYQYEAIEFQGYRYRRALDHPSSSMCNYYRGGSNAPFRYLHHAIWCTANGVEKVPQGHHIHHRDGDPLNNDLENLTCITKEDHNQEHSAEKRERALANPQNLDKAQEAAKHWHKSPEGRAWHKQHALDIAKKQNPRKAQCEWCNGAYLSKKPMRFCSNRCKAASRRASGVDNVDKHCMVCGFLFTTDRFSKALCCSKVCAALGRTRGLY